MEVDDEMELPDRLSKHFISTNPNRLYGALISEERYNDLVLLEKDQEKRTRKVVVYPDEIQTILNNNLYIVHLNGDLREEVSNYDGWLIPNPIRERSDVKLFLKKFDQIKNKGILGILQQKDAYFPNKAFNGTKKVKTIQEYDSKICFYGALRALIAELTRKPYLSDIKSLPLIH